MSAVWSPMTLSELRALEVEQAGGKCRFPACPHPIAELAHLEHRGAGGYDPANTWPNVAGLCNGVIRSARHHDGIDGRRRLHPNELANLVDATIGRNPAALTDVCYICPNPAAVRKRIYGRPDDSPRYSWCHVHAPMFTVQANAYPKRRRVIVDLLGAYKRDQDEIHGLKQPREVYGWKPAKI